MKMKGDDESCGVMTRVMTRVTGDCIAQFPPPPTPTHPGGEGGMKCSMPSPRNHSPSASRAPSLPERKYWGEGGVQGQFTAPPCNYLPVHCTPVQLSTRALHPLPVLTWLHLAVQAEPQVDALGVRAKEARLGRSWGWWWWW